MNIEKTIEYLENIMSSEVRIVTLQEEIKNMQAVLDEKNDYYDYFRNGEFKKIFVPPWIPYRYIDKVLFGPGFRDKSFFELKSDYYDKAPDIYKRMHHTIERTTLQYRMGRIRSPGSFKDDSSTWDAIGMADLARKLCAPLKLAEDCFFICIVHELKAFLGITDPDRSNNLNEDGSYLGTSSTWKYSVTPPARIHIGNVKETGYWGNLVRDLDNILVIDQVIEFDRNAYSFFKEVPEKAAVPSPDSFRRLFHDTFRNNRIKIQERITEGKKRVWEKDTVTENVYELYSDPEIDLMADTLYPFFCEMLVAVNDYLIQCYDLLLEKSAAYVFNKDLARRKLPELERMLNEEKDTLEKLYGLNVIYGKYRGIIPVGSFIDYFASGRCDSFEGPNGAYNLYENELRLDRISDKLDVIIVKLDEIKANQRAMYFALSEMNRTLHALRSSVSTASAKIVNTIQAEASTTRGSLSDISSTLRDISSNTAAISAGQEYSNRLLEMSNERQESIIRNQEFEQLLYTDPSIFGGRIIPERPYGKYH